MPVPTAHVVVAFNASIKTVLVEEKKDSSKLVEDLCPSAFFSAICFFFLPKALSHAMWQHFVVFMSGFRFFFSFFCFSLKSHRVTPRKGVWSAKARPLVMSWICPDLSVARPWLVEMAMCVATWSVEATEVAESSPTAALHRIAPSHAFDAILATRAAAPAHLSHKPLDFCIAICIILLPLLVLGASRAFVPNNVALQAPLVFFIHGAHEVITRR